MEILGSDPAYAGKGYGTALLQWQIQRHQEQHPGVIVFLDTGTDRAQRNYERLGFRETNRKRMDLDLDQEGLPMKEKLTDEERALRPDWHCLRRLVLETKPDGS